VPLALHALLMRTRVTRRLFLGMVGP
jgi:hypothetical protein